jgi:hypothetical protein
MTIEEIYNTEDIGVRSYNVCNDNGLKDLSEILRHHLENKTFENLRNCGRKSNDELTTLCLKYRDYDSRNIDEYSKPKKQFTSIVSNLTRIQREIVNSFIEINFNNLSNRSKNAIASFLKGNLRIRNIAERILANPRFNFKHIKNAGTKSVEEIKGFVDVIIEFVKKVDEVENENDLIVLKNRFLIEKLFSVFKIPSEILESQSVFKIVDFLIIINVIFSKNQNIIFQKAFKLYDGQPELTLDEVAEEINITRERVRLIRKEILESLHINFQFIRSIEDDLYQKYGIDQNQYLINIEADLSNLINCANSTYFTNEFNTFIIYSYLSDEFDLVGEIEDVLLPQHLNSKERHNWNSFYLVKKEISMSFSFERLLNDISLRYEERINETYTFNFKSYLSKFLTSGQIEMLDVIMPIVEKIIFNELNIIIDLEDNIAFKKNTIKHVYEYAYEALEHLGKPSKVKDIVLAVNYLNPYYDTDEPKIRASMKRKHGFVPVGRKSIFGLKRWENEIENFKGGTIRAIAKEFLMEFDEPQHRNELNEYVKQFRPKTNVRSVYNNLCVDESKTFDFFENYFIGLTSKEYSDKYILLSETEPTTKRTWDESWEDLKQFMSDNERLPFSSGCPEEEEKLYRWFNYQKVRVKNNKLNEDQRISIQSIADKYEDSLGKRRSNNEERYVRLKKFVQQYSRLPNAGINGEQNLYAFHYKERKKFEANELDEDDKQKLIEVALLLQRQNI